MSLLIKENSLKVIVPVFLFYKCYKFTPYTFSVCFFFEISELHTGNHLKSLWLENNLHAPTLILVFKCQDEHARTYDER